MFGPRYVWMLVGGYKDRWWEEKDPQCRCTTEELRQATEGYFAVETLNSIIGNQKAVSGLVSVNMLGSVQLFVILQLGPGLRKT